MKNSKFDAKRFLNAKTLNPLEENTIRGGVAEDNVKVRVTVTVKETVTETESGSGCGC
ncbi:hypothetical protein JSO61_003230 [Riemerella anatipestifer]|uniref:hypothetical protein n=1 Tax=Bergeyella anatis TaxID=3113737 RepID=UPI002A89EE90|nr:hypothetical protein [Riemerella anatipestifer]MEC5395831.1 hypothetical protein [Bergeyella sp. RCAD1439]